METYALVILFEHIFRIQSELQDATKRVFADNLPLLDLLGDFLKPVLYSAEIAQNLPEQAYRSGETLANYRRLQFSHHTFAFNTGYFLINPCTLLPQMDETHIGVIGCPTDQFN